ncbi:MAG: primosomal protein N' [Patescibacteria group bacterium]
MIADVVTQKRTGADREIFSYLVPDRFVDEIKVGSIVSVPFGRRRVLAVVVGLQAESASPYKLKEVLAVDGDFTLPEGYLEIARWIADYYLCSLGEAIALFLPPLLKRKIQVERQAVPPILAEPRPLSADQAEVYRRLEEILLAGAKKPGLIFGVTSSGKTEIYLHLAKRTLGLGKQVIVLVPEIVLTPQIIERFRAVFGDQVALIHSDLAKSERFANWSDFYRGRKKIIVGPRSALLVPSANIGLIIVDEEGDSSYKQDKNPKYQASRLAEEIARNQNALLVLGSATPSTETYYRAKAGEIKLLALKNRYGERAMPQTEIVDLRQEMRAGNFSPLSCKLQEEMGRTLATGGQIFLFLNRRGAATFVSCRECGDVVLCPHCSVPLVYHLGGASSTCEVESGYLSCHHCDYQRSTPSTCPACGGYKIKYFGAGVEKIEQEARRLFPGARVRRVDSKTFTSKQAYFDLYRDLVSGRIDILIGTQMIAKGFDLPSVNLVGVVSADVGLHLPYYKALERTFHLLLQVSGRSGRGEKAGRTVIQTYWPESRAIVAATQHNYDLFYAAEIQERQAHHYPPATRLIRVVSENRDPDQAKEEAQKIAQKAAAAGLEVIGPAKAFLARLRGRCRYHLVIKAKTLPDPVLTEIWRSNPYLYWDVDPENLL